MDFVLLWWWGGGGGDEVNAFDVATVTCFHYRFLLKQLKCSGFSFNTNLSGSNFAFFHRYFIWFTLKFWY